ncbi:MAG: hypothetical protein SO253_04560 [Bacilli bacterium]|nr:hypothetical protein [Bacilli bacterium]
MKKCKYCNSSLPDYARYCGKCGEKVNNSDDENNITIFENKEVNNIENYKLSYKRGNLFAIISYILNFSIICYCFGAIFSLIGLYLAKNNFQTKLSNYVSSIVSMIILVFIFLYEDFQNIFVNMFGDAVTGLMNAATIICFTISSIYFILTLFDYNKSVVLHNEEKNK